jgi:hypothetical protein
MATGKEIRAKQKGPRTARKRTNVRRTTTCELKGKQRKQQPDSLLFKKVKTFLT